MLILRSLNLVLFCTPLWFNGKRNYMGRNLAYEFDHFANLYSQRWLHRRIWALLEIITLGQWLIAQLWKACVA